MSKAEGSSGSYFSSPGPATSLVTKNQHEIRQDTSAYSHMLLAGKTFRKFNRGSIGKALNSGDRFVWVPATLDMVCWGKSKEDSKSMKIAAKEIEHIGLLRRTDEHEIVPGFSIQFPNELLEVECSTQDEAELWVVLFTWLKEKNSSVSRPFNVQHNMSVSSDFTWEFREGESIDTVFELGPLLGSGTFGRVHKATHKSSGFTVAVKLVSQHSGADQTDIEREISVLKECKHKHIVNYFGCFGPDADGNLWMIMNYCQFGSIVDLLVSTKTLLTELQISYILASTLLGLHYLHDTKSIIHRDIKGRNILVSNNGTIRLTDFGISKKVVPTTPQTSNLGTIGTGSPHWMAPEVVQDIPATSKSDIWSLGITAIELVTGLPPRANETIYQVMNSTISQASPTLPPPGPGKPAWSYEFHDFVAACLRKSDKARPDVTQLLQHPFILRGITATRCLDSILESLQVPMNPHDDNIANTERSTQQATQQVSRADDFEEGEQLASFHKSFAFEQPYSQPPSILNVVTEFTEPPFLSVVVGNPQTRTSAQSKYSTYPVRVKENEHSHREPPVHAYSNDTGSHLFLKVIQSHEPHIVWRRFSDFYWLYDTIKSIYPYTALPPLPEKTLSGRFDEQVLQLRRQCMQWNQEYIVRHPVLSKSFVIHNFLVQDEAKFQDFKKIVKNKVVTAKKTYKQCNGVWPVDQPMTYDDEAMWMLFHETGASSSMFARLKRNSKETEALLALPNQHYLSVIDAHAKDVITYTGDVGLAQKQYISGFQNLCEVLQKLETNVMTPVLEKAEHGKQILALHCKQVNNQKLSNEGKKFDVAHYLHDVIHTYSEQYQPYFDLHPPEQPKLRHYKRNTPPQLASLLCVYEGMGTVLTPGYTLLGNAYTKTLHMHYTHFIRQMFVLGQYPFSYYNHLYINLRDLIATRDEMQLKCQNELVKTGFATTTTQQEYKYKEVVGTDISEQYHVQAHIDQLISTICDVSNVSPLFSQTSLLKQALPPTIEPVSFPSDVHQQAALHIPDTPLKQQLDRVAGQIILEFTLLQTQKEAHLVKVAKDICREEAALAEKEAIMWNNILRDMEMMPQETEFFDLPL